MFFTIYMHQSGWLSERGGKFLNLLQKGGVPRKGGGGSNSVIYYEISFILKILLLIFSSTSLKTWNMLENTSLMFERSDCTITVYNDLYYNELKI